MKNKKKTQKTKRQRQVQKSKSTSKRPKPKTHILKARPHPLVLTKELVCHLDKQIYNFHTEDNTLISRFKSFMNDFCGSSYKTVNKARHHHEIVLSKNNSRIIVYSEPTKQLDPIVIALYGGAKFESASIKESLSGNFVIERAGTNCKSLSLKTTKEPAQIIPNLIENLNRRGYSLVSHQRKRNFYYLENFTWQLQGFTITLRCEPFWFTMAPAALQIDRFLADEVSYVDLVWLLKTIQQFGITAKPHEIEYQHLFRGAPREVILDLLQRTSLSWVQTLGYSNKRREELKPYNLEISSDELLNSTHYIGQYSSPLQTRTYMMPGDDPKLEFILREKYLTGIGFLKPEDLFMNNPWNSLCKRVIFGEVELGNIKNCKNREIYEQALEQLKISLHWGRQTLPAGSNRYLKIDEAYTGDRPLIFRLV